MPGKGNVGGARIYDDNDDALCCWMMHLRQRRMNAHCRSYCIALQRRDDCLCCEQRSKRNRVRQQAKSSVAPTRTNRGAMLLVVGTGIAIWKVVAFKELEMRS